MSRSTPGTRRRNQLRRSDPVPKATTQHGRTHRNAHVARGRRGAASPEPGRAELPVTGTRLAVVRHGRSSTTLLLQDVPMAARQQLIEALPEAATSAFGARSDVEGMVSVDGDVLVRLTGVASNPSAVGPAGPSNGREAWSAPSMLMRLGLLADRRSWPRTGTRSATCLWLPHRDTEQMQYSRRCWRRSLPIDLPRI